MIDAVFLVE